MNKNPLKNSGVQTLLASILCIIVGMLVGYVVLLAINAEGAKDAILAVMKNFLTYPSKQAALKYLGNTLVKTAPLLMCAMSILFAYKVGLFNIGAAGQYVAGACACLYAALAWGMPWWACMLVAMIAGGVLGVISGALKAYCNVNEVISGIMLNWIGLYTTNMILSRVKETASPYTLSISGYNKSALLPNMGLDTLFTNNKYVTIAIPLAIIITVVLQIVLTKTKFGYELRATGNNKNAAKYCGMAEKRNTVLTLAIAGAIAGLGASMLYLSGYEQWMCTQSSVPSMGFNGIAAAFLGGLNPIGTIFASYFFSHITAGGAYVDKTMYCAQISDLISALIIYLCGFVLFFREFMNRLIARQEEKTRAKQAANNKEGGKE